MSITATGWSNATGTTGESCPCGTWKDHWLKHSGKSWPAACSVKDCTEPPTLGAHIENPSVTGRHIVPMCDSCNGSDGAFDLAGGVTLVPAKAMSSCGT